MINPATINPNSFFGEVDIKPEKIEFPSDIIAWQIANENISNKLESLKEPTDEDFKLALEIRKYYSEKILIQQLADVENVSQFTNALYKVVTQHFTKTTSDYSGIIYRIPEFYKHDIALTSILEQGETYCYDSDIPPPYFDPEDNEIEYIDYTITMNKRYDEKHYWFRTKQRKNLVIFKVVKNYNKVSLFIDDYISNNENLFMNTENLTYAKLIDPTTMGKAQFLLVPTIAEFSNINPAR